MRVLIAYSDTGGGHRAAANNLRDALQRRSEHIAVRLVDPYAMSGRWPFDRLSAAYPRVINGASWLWRSGFRLTNSRGLTACAHALAWPALRPTFAALHDDGVPDVIVSTHPLLTSPLRRAFRDVPLAVVVTDLVSGHASWYYGKADLVITPTSEARRQALAYGVPSARAIEVGLPVAPSFVHQRGEQQALARQLGWSVERPTVVLIGGGEGVGPLEQIAEAIDGAALPCDLAIVTGRNAPLAQRLRARTWTGCVHIYDFVNTLGLMLRAASALVTKAGPGTICEAFAAGCPLVLYGAIPGQESGNVQLVRESGGGVWAPSAEAVTNALRAWFVGDDATTQRARAAQAALAAARPFAADDIAERIVALANARALTRR